MKKAIEDLVQEGLLNRMQKKGSFEPVLIDKYESAMLHVKEGYPALLLDHIAYDISETPIEYCRSIVRGDCCKFYTELLIASCGRLSAIGDKTKRA
ncbi:UTRA domain-containing protein [Alicyclobacillus fastidiosus]|uniref:UTRA domain-containing protein n=1 Tax=Alicyclobacillus fastidiosus TaxID=392011 RepID=UPI0023E9F357|nr:UTRA domain-containing protein [Alicyclobacillus fastidiosus]GMA65045.1 hypothetical protein GCM10025859_54850 [Alicyclobacillus fastidiosus]